MFLDIIFQIWKRLSGKLQWRFLWLVNSKFMVCVSGVVFDEDRCILLQRHRHWVQDVWGLPGGIVQSGETLEEAFAREVFEETRLVISGIELVQVVSNYRLRLEMYFRANLDENSKPRDIHLQKQEVLEARFFPYNQLPLNLLPIQKKVIEQVVNLT
ncbi:MAG: NUDIX domain-containing protein [Anaerolineales bacterium]